MKCPAWFDKFELEMEREKPEILSICGGMSLDAVEHAKRYIAFRKEFCEKYGFEKEEVYLNVPMSGMRKVLSFKKGAKIREETIEKIAGELKNKKGVTVDGIRKMMEISPNRSRPYKEPLEIRLPSNPQIALVESTNGGIKEKERHICTANSNGLNSILADIQAAGFADSDYSAHCLAYKWAAERLKEEIAKKAVV